MTIIIALGFVSIALSAVAIVGALHLISSALRDILAGLTDILIALQRLNKNQRSTEASSDTLPSQSSVKFP